ncbi:hypothetical protein ACWCZ5_34205, partial [Streptomyces sp. NPDC001667]
STTCSPKERASEAPPGTGPGPQHRTSPRPAAPTSCRSASGPAAPAPSTAQKPYLHQRWKEGCTNAAQLFAELRERGNRGGTTIVRQYIHRIREAFPHDDAPRKPPSVRKATSWITRHPDSFDANEAQ